MSESKRLIYVTLYDFDKGESSGVIKKILQQVKAFKQNGFEVEYFFSRSKTKELYIHSEQDILLGKARGIKSIDYCNFIRKYLKEHHYDCAYVRHTGRIDPWILSVLKVLHMQGVKIVYEFPTFPYSKVAYNISGNIDLMIDQLCKGQLKKYVSRVITFSQDSCIYGIPAIRIINGILVDEVFPIKKHLLDDTIDLIAVAAVHSYHGYDRVITALGKYYQAGGKEKIKLHIVGEGKELENYDELAAKYHISKQVILYGAKAGKELDDIYNVADIALGAFAAYRIGITNSSSLKIREYLAKGLPVIVGCKEDALQVGYQYFMECANDDSVIDIENFIKFYNKIYKGDETVVSIRNNIREYAKKTVDMQVTLEPVYNFFNEEQKNLR